MLCWCWNLKCQHPLEILYHFIEMFMRSIVKHTISVEEEKMISVLVLCSWESRCKVVRNGLSDSIKSLLPEDFCWSGFKSTITSPAQWLYVGGMADILQILHRGLSVLEVFCQIYIAVFEKAISVTTWLKSVYPLGSVQSQSHCTHSSTCLNPELEHAEQGTGRPLEIMGLGVLWKGL